MTPSPPEVYRDPSAMEPMLPDGADLDDLALSIVRRSAALGVGLHPITRASVVDLLRNMNSYYSNLIEGHATHPADIERALHGEYSEDPAKRELQIEGRAHVEVNRLIDATLFEDPETRVCSGDFLCWVHREFYERLPSVFRVVRDPVTGEEREVVPGKLRDTEVIAGRHLAPSHDSLPRFLDRFSRAYEPNSLTATRRVLAFAASHHRLLWIHPFLDGNGRVARLFSNAYARKVEIGSHGLWAVGRGLARRRQAYMESLAKADEPRRNDYDGRGNLSLEALENFCRFFLETSLDQIRFMTDLLEVHSLAERIEKYVNLRSAGLVTGLKELRSEAAHLLVGAMVRGELVRGDAGRIAGLGTRTARSLVSQLVEEKLLYSESPKGALRFGLPLHVVDYYFPRLIRPESTAPE